MMQNLVLAKIGGSSLKGPTGFKNALEILRARPDIKAVVISATFDTTNILEDLASKALPLMDV